MSASIPLPLFNIFTRLREAGMGISTRDYLDALHALDIYSEPFSGVHHCDRRADVSIEDETVIRRRSELSWLCQTLWARNEKERELVQRIVTREIGLAPSRLSIALKQNLDLLERVENEDAWVDPSAFASYSPDNEDEQNDEDARKSQNSASISTKLQPHVAAEIVSENGDLSLPVIQAPPIEEDDLFSMEEEEIISPLWLQALWRRFFVSSCFLETEEIDVPKTVVSVAKNGALTEPVMKRRAVNTVSLVLLIDVNAPMQSWQTFEHSMVQSIRTKRSRIQDIEIAYFSLVPGNTLFRSRALREPVQIDSLFRGKTATSVVVFGEAGAISRNISQRKKDKFNQFLTSMGRKEVKNILWVNPMAASRWKGSYMECISGHPRCYSIPLDSESLLRGIDLLRGAH